MCGSRTNQNLSANKYVITEDKELQSFLGILSYLSTFSPVNAEVCGPSCKLTSIKTKWTWNRTYQDICEQAKAFIKRDECMKFYDVARPLHLESDTSIFIQVRNGIN